VVTGPLTIDGTADSAYGAPIFVSNTGTGFGDATNGDPVLTNGGMGGGSEIANAYATLADVDSDGTADTLYMLFGGNLEENFNKLHLYFDVDAEAAEPAGQNVIRDDNPDISFDGLNRQAGLQFDDGIAPDFVLFYNFGQTGTDTLGNPIIEAFADIAALETEGGGVGAFVGGGTPALDRPLLLRFLLATGLVHRLLLLVGPTTTRSVFFFETPSTSTTPSAAVVASTPSTPSAASSPPPSSLSTTRPRPRSRPRQDDDREKTLLRDQLDPPVTPPPPSSKDEEETTTTTTENSLSFSRRLRYSGSYGNKE